MFRNSQNNLRQESFQVLIASKCLAYKSLQVHTLTCNSQCPVTQYGKYHLNIPGYLEFDFYIDCS